MSLLLPPSSTRLRSGRSALSPAAGRLALLALASGLTGCTFSFDRDLYAGEIRAAFTTTVTYGTSESTGPAAGATAVLVGTPFSGSSDAEGRIAFRGVPAGTFAMTVVLAPDGGVPQAMVDLNGISLPAGGGRDLGTILLTAAGSVSGKLLLSGQPVPDTAVQVLDGAGVPLAGLPTVRSDPTGHYAIPYLPAGEERVSALFSTTVAGVTTELAATSLPFQVVPRQATQVDIVLESPAAASPGELRVRVAATVGALAPSQFGLELLRDDGTALSYPQEATSADVTAIPPGVYAVLLSATGFQNRVLPNESVTGVVDLGTIVLVPQPASPAACATLNGGCDANASCTVAPAGPVCACKPGYVGNGYSCTAELTLATLVVSAPSAGVEAGHMLQLDAKGTWSDGSMKDVTALATWTSSAPLVASVSSGLVQGVAAGSAQVSASLDGVTSSLSLTVTASALTGITVGAVGPLAPGTVVQLHATGIDDDGAMPDVTSLVAWSGNNPQIATVTLTGLLTAVSAGTVTVTARLDGISGTESIAVDAPVFWTVTGAGDGEETISPIGAQSVVSGSTAVFTVDAQAGYTVSTTTGGTCPPGTWLGDVYSTGPIVADCAVSFAATIDTYRVTVSGDGRETINPAAAQVVAFSARQSFTVDATTGYVLSATVGGTCTAGAWVGDVYTTGVITADCSVSFSALQTYQVTASGDGEETITPGGPQSVVSGLTQTYGVSAATGYRVSALVQGTCPPGSWSGANYTTGFITTHCTVIFSATPMGTYQVIASGDGQESILPAEGVVSSGASFSTTLTATAGDTVSTVVNGTCPAGSWSGGRYATGAVSDDCTVTFVAFDSSSACDATSDTFCPIGAVCNLSAECVAPEYTINVGSTVTDQVTGLIWQQQPATESTGDWDSSGIDMASAQYECATQGLRLPSLAELFSLMLVHDDGDFRPMADQVAFPESATSWEFGSWQFWTATTEGTGTAWYVDFDPEVGPSTASTDPAAGNSYAAWCVGDAHPQVTAAGDGDETIAPVAAQAVAYGAVASVQVDPLVGYAVATVVGGSCAPGSWVGDVYSTGAVMATCSLSFTAVPCSSSVTASGDGLETVSPMGAEMVGCGGTQSYTVTPEAGYVVSPIVGGTCPGGSWSGDVYTTGIVESACSVTFSVSCGSSLYGGAVLCSAGAACNPAGQCVVTSYTANGNGTVTDNVTGLLWQAPQATLAYTWDSTGAATGSGQYYCAHLSLAGRASGWRLPTLPELFSLVDNTGSQPTINTAAFPGTTAAGYWTSTQESPGFGAWVDFINGDTSNASSNSGLLVRCVQ